MKFLKYIPILILCLVGKSYAIDSRLDLYDFTGGILDIISPDRMQYKYTPDCINISLDDDMGIVKRSGYIDLNSTALTDSRSILETYVYKQSDGDQYLIVNSSASIFKSLSGASFDSIKSGLTLNTKQTFETALDKLYGGNGTDNEWTWDGTTFTEYTVSNSTNMVKAKYHCYWKNRMFRAGVNSYPLTLYFSEIETTSDGAPNPNPANMGTTGTNWEYIPQTGEVIKAIARSSNGDNLFIFTTYSTWALVGDDPTNWRLICINPYIGCLYQSSIDYLNGNIMLVSHRGIEEFNGETFNLKSKLIDKQVKKLKQINVNQDVLSQSTASDWGAGTGINIDTTTTSGSVLLKASTNYWEDYYLAYTTSIATPGRSMVCHDIDCSSDGVVSAKLISEYYYNAPESYLTRVIVSTNSGQSYYSTNITTTSWPLKIKISDSGSVMAIASRDVSSINRGYIYTSTDTGKTWSKNSVAGDWYSVCMGKNTGQYIYAVKDALYIYKSDDYGATWTLNRGSGYSYYDIDCSNNGAIILTAVNYNKTEISYNYGVSWSQKTSLGGSFTCCMSDDGAYQYVLTSDNGLYRSIDSGANWNLINSVVMGSWDNNNNYFKCTSNGKSMIGYNGSKSYAFYNYGTYTKEINITTVLGSDELYNICMDNTGLIQQCGRADYYYNMISTNTGTFSSQILSATNWGSWGSLTVDETKPSGSSVLYYIKTSTASDNFTSKTQTLIGNGSTINSTDGGYVEVISSFSRTDISSIPQINSFDIAYYGTGSNPMYGKTYNDSYYLSVSTGSTAYNNVVYKLNKNGIFEVFNNMNFNGMAVYLGDMIAGDATSTGKLYKLNIEGIYTDSTGSFNSEYITPIIDCNSTLSEKAFKAIWITSSSDTEDFNLSYRLNGSNGSWTSLNPSVVTDRINVQKIPITNSPRARQIQFKIDSTSYFNIKGMTLIYEELPLQ